MVANTNTSKNWNPRFTPIGHLVSGRDKKYKNARYGNKLDMNRVAATSVDVRVAPFTDHAFAIDVIKVEELLMISGSAIIFN